MKTDLIFKRLSPLKLSFDESSVFEEHITEADREFPASTEGHSKSSFLMPPKPRSTYERVKCSDFIFVFKYDENDPNILRIFSRHMTTEDDAINLFLTQDAIWDEERKRFANFSDTHGLYWFWRDEPKKVVMVISCFKRQPEH